jgi:hypothetical protein
MQHHALPNDLTFKHPGVIARHLESVCRMRHFVSGLLPNQDGDLCKRLRFKWYGARKFFLNAFAKWYTRESMAAVQRTCEAQPQQTSSDKR